jgi:hypothetical protein
MSASRFPSRACASEQAEERFNTLQSIRWTTYAWFLAKGVKSEALFYPEIPALADVVFNEAGTFDFHSDVGEEGTTALVFLARGEDGAPADLVAWSPSPRKLASWQAASSLLGAEEVLAPRLTAEAALAVHRTPLGWLKCGREGVVLVDPRSAAVALRDFGPFVTESVEHGQELRELFRQREPRIFVRKRAA